MIDTVHRAFKIQRLTSLVYHLAFPLELLLQEFVAILFLALQGPVKNVENQDSHFAHALLINFRDKINFIGCSGLKMQVDVTYLYCLPLDWRYWQTKN